MEFIKGEVLPLGGITPHASTNWYMPVGHGPTGRQYCRRGPGRPGEQLVECEPVTLHCDREKAVSL